MAFLLEGRGIHLEKVDAPTLKQEGQEQTDRGDPKQAMKMDADSIGITFIITNTSKTDPATGDGAWFKASDLDLADSTIVGAKNIYGGTFNLLRHTLPRDGITTTFVSAENPQEFEDAIQENTKLVYFETFGNPNADLPDFEAISEIAHKHNLPVIVDNTFATPYLFRKRHCAQGSGRHTAVNAGK